MPAPRSPGTSTSTSHRPCSRTRRRLSPSSSSDRLPDPGSTGGSSSHDDDVEPEDPGVLADRTNSILRIAEVEVRLEPDRRGQRLGDEDAGGTDRLQQIGGQETGRSRVEDLQQVGMWSPDELPVLAAECGERSTDTGPSRV